MKHLKPPWWRWVTPGGCSLSPVQPMASCCCLIRSDVGRSVHPSVCLSEGYSLPHGEIGAANVNLSNFLV